MIALDELVALAELLDRTPMTKAEGLWVAGLVEKLRDWVLDIGDVEGAEGKGLREVKGVEGN